MHTEAWAKENEPAAHGVCPVALQAKPAMHGVHADARAAENAPAAHGAHELALADANVPT